MSVYECVCVCIGVNVPKFRVLLYAILSKKKWRQIFTSAYRSVCLLHIRTHLFISGNALTENSEYSISNRIRMKPTLCVGQYRWHFIVGISTVLGLFIMSNLSDAARSAVFRLSFYIRFARNELMKITKQDVCI